MATYTKPPIVPEWAVTGTRTEPSAGKKNTGWIFEESPPYDFFNWLQGIAGDWFNWIDERLGDGTTADDLRIASGFDLEINDPDFYLKVLSDTPQIVFDADGGIDRLYYDRADNSFNFDIGGVIAAVIGSAKTAIPGGLQVGTGTVTPAAGSGIFSRGLAVGFDYAPLDDRVYIGDSNFLITGDPGFPQIEWDAGDLLFWDRSGNALNVRIGNINKIAMLSDGIFANRGTFREYIEAPANQDNLTARSYANNILACGTFISQGGANNALLVSDKHYNIAGDAIWQATGTFAISLDQGVNTAAIPITNTSTNYITGAAVSSPAVWAFYVYAGSTGNATNPLANSKIYFALIGAPLAAPTPF